MVNAGYSVNNRVGKWRIPTVPVAKVGINQSKKTRNCLSFYRKKFYVHLIVLKKKFFDVNLKLIKGVQKTIRNNLRKSLWTRNSYQEPPRPFFQLWSILRKALLVE